jgi:CRP-like cAMP-binding protein
MPREVTKHSAVIEAIRNSGLISELLEKHDNHFKYELDLELIVYGRTYADKRVGPYASLLVFGPGEEILHEGDWGGNSFYILIDGRLDVHATDEQGTIKKIGEVEIKNSFGEMSVLAGEPRNATVVVPQGAEATVLRIQRPALRLLRKLKKFGDLLEQNYRRYGLDHALREIQDATGKAFSSETLERLRETARFKVYAKDHILFREGDAVEDLIFIESGWVRRVRGITSDIKLARTLTAKPVLGDLVTELDEDVGLDFLGAGNWLGLDAVFTAERTAWNYSATVASRTDALEISIADLRSNSSLVKTISDYFPKFSCRHQSCHCPGERDFNWHR